MKKTKKKIVFIGGGIVLFFVFVLVVAALVFYLDKPLVKNILQGYISKKFGMTLAIGKLDYKLFPLSVDAFFVKAAQKSDTQDMDAALDRIHMKGNLWKALKNKRPLLEMVEVENVSVHMYQKITIDSDYKNPLPLLADALSVASEAKIKNVSYFLYSSSQEISLFSANLNVSKASGEEQHRFDFTGAQIDFQDTGTDASFRCGMDAEGTLDFSGLSVLEGDFSFSQLEATLSGKKAALDSLNLAVRAEYGQEGEVVSLSRFDLKIPSLLEATGTGRAEFAQGVSFSVDSVILLQNIEKSLDVLKPFLPQKIEGLSLRGQAELRGKASIFSTSAGREIDFSGTLKLLPAKLGYLIPGLVFDSSVSGELEAAGSASNMEFSGLLRLNGGTLSRENIEVRGLSLQLPLLGSRLAVKSELFKGAIENFTFRSGDRSTAVDAVDFEGKGSFDAGSMDLFLDSVDVRASTLPALHIEARAGLKPGGDKRAKLQAKEVDVAQLRSLLSFFFPERLADWKFDGRGSIDLEVQQSPDEDNEIWNVHGELDMSEVLFQDPAFILAGEALRPTISWKAEYLTEPEQVEFSLFFALDQGESLWKEMYVSWSENPIRGDMSGLLRLPQKEVKIHSMAVNFSPFGSADVTGSVKFEEPYSLDLKGKAHLSLDAFDAGLLGLRPHRQEIFRLKGEAGTDFHLAVMGKSLKVSGELFIKDGLFENLASDLSVQGIEARIPFDFGADGEEGLEEKARPSEEGYFLAQTLETPHFGVEAFELNISSGKNKFLIEPFSIALFGGTAAFEKSSFSVDPDSLVFSGISSLILEGIDVSLLPIESEQFKLKGTAKANFSQVELTPYLISTQGAGEVDMFDGKARIENIKVFSPFSKGRTISLDITLENFSLEKMTDAIPFGRVTGILRGEIKGLAISYGQPESFALHLESVRRKGVSQLFSLKAVNDLTVLSSGEKSGFSTLRGIARFVPSFPYAKIGISSTLDNDMFTLKGTVKEDGTEYLVKRSWLTGINVINRNPDKKISFKDMINRLKSIGKSSETKR